jgi:hypothetical protein
MHPHLARREGKEKLMCFWAYFSRGCEFVEWGKRMIKKENGIINSKWNHQSPSPLFCHIKNCIFELTRFSISD